ncbi:MAG: hypothetical protein HZC40_07580 [Chloroflexi bacterium]|nr:hypothetical protein [Chloroflexota bacterium]
MRLVLMILCIIIASAATAVAGYYYGFDQGQTQATNIRTEFFTQRGATTSGTPSASSSNATPDASQGGQPGQGQQRNPAGQLAAQRGVIGVVKSVQGNTMQVTLANGNTVSVTLDAQTTIQKLGAGTQADLQAGQRVTVQGDQSGGAMVARTVILGLGQ